MIEARGLVMERPCGTSQCPIAGLINATVCRPVLSATRETDPIFQPELPRFA